MSKKKKTFVLDTNVLLSDPDAINAFDEHHVIIPLVVLEELDNNKNRPDEVGANARKVSRTLDQFRISGQSRLSKGVKLRNGGVLKVMGMDASDAVTLPPDMANKADNHIIAFALALSKTVDCTLVSKDINVRIKCDSLGLKSDDYFKMRAASAADDIYTGVARALVTPDMINEFFHDGYIALDPEIEKTLHPNEIVVMKDVTESHSALGRFVGPGEGVHALLSVEEVFGLKPRNKEQKFALNLLLDPNIKLVSITGAAGCGKTLLTLAAGLDQVIGKGRRYERLIVSRPVQPMGKDIGFLPGTLEEKMDPWIAPIKDNLTFLIGGKQSKKVVSKKNGEPDREFKRDPYIDMMFDDKTIEIEALTYIRGRSIPNSYMIIDECQNLTVHELKTIITRIGDGTKIVLLGDLEQIDNTHVDMFTNGLTYAVERFKDYKIAGHITLLKGERSELASLAAKIL